jgi:hypothetical protein
MSLFEINNPHLFENIDHDDFCKGTFPVSLLLTLEHTLSEPFNYFFTASEYVPNTILNKDSITFCNKNGTRFIDVMFPNGNIEQTRLEWLPKEIGVKITAICEMFKQ